MCHQSPKSVPLQTLKWLIVIMGTCDITYFIQFEADNIENILLILYEMTKF